MKVAVVGAGYAGLAVAWQLLQRGEEVTVFDKGEGASHASTGLLHPAPGLKAAPSWRSDEGMAATLELLEKAGPVFEQSGILRYAVNEKQKALFQGPTQWIAEGITVYSRPYLQALKRLCHKATFVEKQVESLEELESFDAIILTSGAEILKFASLPLVCNIGQCLICRWPERLPHSLLAQAHVTPTEDPSFCLIGSTYEHTPKPNPQKALELLNILARVYPAAKDFKVEEIRVGMRIAPKVGYRPLIEKIGPKTWVFAGLGSRGLLYHALLSKELLKMIFPL